MMPAWMGVALVLVILAGMMAALKTYQARCNPHPEWVRKLLHLSMGLVTLSFPWVFDSPWPVLLLAIFSSVGLAAVKFSKALKGRVGSVVGAVERGTLGEIYFPIAVCALFFVSKGDPLLYCIPILILTLADSVSALVGVHYGVHRYATGEGEKSAEGSVAFFMVAFLSAHIPLLLLTQLGRAETLCIGLMMGLVIMLFEAISWRGLDNLFIPLVSFILLKTYLNLGLEDLLLRLVVITALVVFTRVWRRRTTLNQCAILGVALSLYIFWAVGGWAWLMPPLVLFATYRWLLPREYLTLQGVHDLKAVIATASTGYFWLFLFRTFDSPNLLFPYTVALAVHLAIIAIAHHQTPRPNPSEWGSIAMAILKSWLLMFVPYLYFQDLSKASVGETLLALVYVTLGTLCYYVFQPKRPVDLSSQNRWVRQAVFAAVASFCGFAWMMRFRVF